MATENIGGAASLLPTALNFNKSTLLHSSASSLGSRRVVLDEPSTVAAPDQLVAVRRADLLAPLIVRAALDDCRLDLLALRCDHLLLRLGVEEEVLEVLRAIVEALPHLDLRRIERRVDVLRRETRLVQISVVADAVGPSRGQHALVVYALLGKRKVLLLDRGHEYLHHPLRRHVVRNILDRVPALLDPLDTLLADEDAARRLARLPPPPGSTRT